MKDLFDLSGTAAAAEASAYRPDRRMPQTFQPAPPPSKPAGRPAAVAERRALAGKEEARPASVMLPGDGARIEPPDPDPPNAFKSAGVAETQPLQEAGRVGQPCSFELREPPIPSYDQYVERLCRSRNLRYFSNRVGRPHEQLSLSYGLAAG